MMAGTGRDYRLSDLRLDSGVRFGVGGTSDLAECTIPSGAVRILKRYNDKSLPRVDEDSLRHIIDWPNSLDSDAQLRLAQLCAWPEAVVTQSGRMIGVVIPKARVPFFERRSGKRIPRHISRIAVRQDIATKRGLSYYDFPHKLARLGNVLGALQFLHGHKVVIGDLQWKNILTTRPDPVDDVHSTDVYLVDCDSFIVGGRAAITHDAPKIWDLPYRIDDFTATTDLGKFALMTIRSLSERLNGDEIVYKHYKNLLPSSDFTKLDALYTQPDPGLTSNDLSSLARAWQNSVRQDGKLYRRCDGVTREVWTDAMRRAHLAGLPADSYDTRADAASPTSSRPKPSTTATSKPATSSKNPLTGSNPATTFKPAPGAGTGGTKPNRPPTNTPSNDTSRSPSKPGRDESSPRRGIWVGGSIVAVMLVAGVTVAQVQGSKETTPSTAPTTSRTSTTTPAPSAAPSFSPTAFLIRNAHVGDCIHREPGADNGDGTAQVTVTAAPCGSYGSEEVTQVATDTAACGNQGWVRNSDATSIVVLCLRPA